MMVPSWIQFTYPSAQKNTGYCCAWSILRKSSETGFPLIGGWSLNPIMIFLELPYESRCPLCGPLHLTVKLPAHWKLNLPSFKTEALFQEMIFTRKFRLQKLALISVSLFFYLLFCYITINSWALLMGHRHTHPVVNHCNFINLHPKGGGVWKPWGAMYFEVISKCSKTS